MNHLFIVVNNSHDFITTFNNPIFNVGSNVEVINLNSPRRIEVIMFVDGFIEQFLKSMNFLFRSISNQRKILLSQTLVNASNLLRNGIKRRKRNKHREFPLICCNSYEKNLPNPRYSVRHYSYISTRTEYI